MKIIDCFIFYNEIDMLNYRLNVLNEYVDYFVIVESDKTFVGNNKKLYFEENKHKFDFISNKIIHIVVDDFVYLKNNINFHNNEQWKNEHHQRNSITKGIEKLSLDDDDIIIISDVDEIPDPNILKNIKNNNIKITIHALIQDFYYYNLNSKISTKWPLSKILNYKKFKEHNKEPQQIRFANCDKILNGGWHLSCFGDSSFIKNKLENFSHQEFNNTEYTDVDKIKYRIDNFIDILNRNDIKIIKLSFSENNYLPPQCENLLKQFIVLP